MADETMAAEAVQDVSAEGVENANPGDPVVEPSDAEKAAASDFEAAPWQDSLPESWRGELEGLNSLDDALDAMKRGMGYKPAVDISELETSFPEGVTVDDGFNKQFRELGVKIGLTKDQAQALVNFEVEQQIAMRKQAAEEGTEELRRQWGADYDRNAEKATQAMLRIDNKMGNRLSAALGEGGLANSPILVETFALIGDLISEDSLAGGSATGSQQMQPESAVSMFKGMSFR